MKGKENKIRSNAENAIQDTMEMLDKWEMTKGLSKNERFLIETQLNQIARSANLDARSAMTNAVDESYNLLKAKK